MVIGPGLIVMEADNDAGAVSTYTQAGAQYGLHMLWLMLFLLPVCYFIQEMVARLGIATGQGHAAMIYKRFGKWWGHFSLFDLLIVNFLTLITEFAAIAMATQRMGLCRGKGLAAQPPDAVSRGEGLLCYLYRLHIAGRSGRSNPTRSATAHYHQRSSACRAHPAFGYHLSATAAERPRTAWRRVCKQALEQRGELDNYTGALRPLSGARRAAAAAQPVSNNIIK